MALTHVSLLAGLAFTARAFCGWPALGSRLAVFQTRVRAVVKYLVPATEVAGTLVRRSRLARSTARQLSTPDVVVLQAYSASWETSERLRLPGGQTSWRCSTLVLGLLLEVFAAPLWSHDMAGVGGILPLLKRGDVLVADRGLRSFADLALLDPQGASHATFRWHQKQIVDFALTPGRAACPARSEAGTQGDSSLQPRGVGPAA